MGQIYELPEVKYTNNSWCPCGFILDKQLCEENYVVLANPSEHNKQYKYKIVKYHGDVARTVDVDVIDCNLFLPGLCIDIFMNKAWSYEDKD